MKVKVILNGEEKVEEMETISHIPVLVEVLKKKYKTNNFKIIEIEF